MGCPLPTGESGSGLGGGCAPFTDFFKFLSENGEFWCILDGTLCDLLTHLLSFKRNRGNVQVNVRKDQRMRLSFLPEQLVRSSQQLVLKDTKRGFIRPCRKLIKHHLNLVKSCAYFVHVQNRSSSTSKLRTGQRPLSYQYYDCNIFYNL